MKRLLFLLSLVFLSGNLLALEQPEIADFVRQKIDSGDAYSGPYGRPEIALRFGLEAYQYMGELEHDPALQKRLLNYLAHCFSRLHREELAIPHLEHMLRIEERTESKHTKLYTITLGSLGSFYLKFGDQVKSLQAYREAVEVSINIPQQVYHASAINNLGIYYEEIDHLNSALNQYEQAIRSLSWGQREDTMLYCSIRDNQASVYAKQGRLQEAVALLHANLAALDTISGNNQLRPVKNYVNTVVELCDRYIELEQLQPISTLLEEAQQKIEPIDSWEHHILRGKIENCWINYARLTSDNDLLKQHLKLANEVLQQQLQLAQDRSIKTDQILADYTTRQINYKLDRRSQQLAIAQQEARFNRIWLILIGVFSAFVVIALYLFNKRRIAFQKMQNVIREQELENQRLKVDQLQLDLSHIETDYSNLLMQNMLKKNWSTEIAQKLASVVDSSNEVDREALQQLQHELKQQSNIHEKIDLHQIGQQDANARFFHKLSEKYPTLTAQEKEVCGLMRLKLDGKEIASIRNINPSSVRKMRQRIRKKIGLSPEVDLYELLQSL